MWAAEDKQFDATQLLIEQGANVHIRDLVQLTHYLVEIGFPQLYFSTQGASDTVSANITDF